MSELPSLRLFCHRVRWRLAAVCGALILSGALEWLGAKLGWALLLWAIALWISFHIVREWLWYAWTHTMIAVSWWMRRRKWPVRALIAANFIGGFALLAAAGVIGNSRVREIFIWTGLCSVASTFLMMALVRLVQPEKSSRRLGFGDRAKLPERL